MNEEKWKVPAEERRLTTHIKVNTHFEISLKMEVTPLGSPMFNHVFIHVNLKRDE